MTTFARAISESKAKEEISCAYIKGIIAQAGLNHSCHVVDEGIDFLISSSKPVLPGYRITDQPLALQVKARTDWQIADECISFQCKKKTYDDLTEDVAIGRLLVLYTLPRERSKWIVNRNFDSIFSHNAYFTSIARLGISIPTGSTKRVSVPTANRLTASSLLDLYLCMIGYLQQGGAE